MEVDSFQIEEKHQDYAELSLKIRIESSEKVGRFFVASEEIQANETLLSEEPFSAILYQDKQGTHCSHCLQRFKIAYGCKMCATVAFCSHKCREEAQNSHHQWECQYQDVITGLGCSSVAKLALRLITSRPLSYFLDRKDSILAKAKVTNDKYLQLLTLVGLERQRWPEDQLAKATMALVLLGVLKASGYFDQQQETTSSSSSSKPGETYDTNEIFIGSLILKHLQVSLLCQRFGD